VGLHATKSIPLLLMTGGHSNNNFIISSELGPPPAANKDGSHHHHQGARHCGAPMLRRNATTSAWLRSMAHLSAVSPRLQGR
jgi:hypothetical protein